MRHVSEEPWLRRSVHWVTRSLSLCFFLRLFIRGRQAAHMSEMKHNIRFRFGSNAKTRLGEIFAIWQQLKRPTIYRWEQLFPPERFMSRYNLFCFVFFYCLHAGFVQRLTGEQLKHTESLSAHQNPIWFPELSKGCASRIIWYPIYIKKKKNYLSKSK